MTQQILQALFDSYPTGALLLRLHKRAAQVGLRLVQTRQERSASVISTSTQR